MTLSELFLTTSALSLMEMDSNFPSPVRSVKSDPITLKDAGSDSEGVFCCRALSALIENSRSG